MVILTFYGGGAMENKERVGGLWCPDSFEDLKPGEGYGPVHDWQGRFRVSADSQKYGTPTFWLLDKNGTVLAKPFYGNLYHEKPFEIKYSVIEVDKVIQALL